jgi:hypothetical protein
LQRARVGAEIAALESERRQRCECMAENRMQMAGNNMRLG